MLVGLGQGYRDTETWNVSAQPRVSTQMTSRAISLERSNGTGMKGPPTKAIGTLAEL